MFYRAAFLVTPLSSDPVVITNNIKVLGVTFIVLLALVFLIGLCDLVRHPTQKDVRKEVLTMILFGTTIIMISIGVNMI